MKNGKASLWVVLLVSLFLGACSNANGQVAEFITAIQEASSKTAELDNGEFTYTIGQAGEEEFLDQVTEGVFLNRGEEPMDWYTRLKMEGKDTPVTLTENLQKEGTQYQRIGLVDAQNQYLDKSQNGPDEQPAWQLIAEEATEAPPSLEPLLQIELKESDVESVEVTQEGEDTHYHFRYTEGYLADLKQEAVADVESHLEQSKEDGLPTGVIAALEQNLERINNIDYLSVETIATVDEAGILIQYINESSIDHPVEEGKQELHLETRVELKGYNQPEIEADFSNIEL